MSSTSTSVTTTATPLVLGTTIPYGSAAAGQVLIYNEGPSTVYLGANQDVTATTGSPLAAGETLPVALPGGRTVYAITASGSAIVRLTVL